LAVRQLPETLQNRIAAGEVVERPASVVKELVENALDAGATRIAIEIDGGGKDLIRISDDGGGMTRADLVLAVERHATSKLPSDDLDDIRYLGFRGEALPSIGAVATLTLTSRHPSEPHAWALVVDGGRKAEARPAALSKGTIVEVRDLFHAVPARLKFLKSERAEIMAVVDVVERLALGAPAVRFNLRLGDRPERVFAGGLGEIGAKARLAEIVGGDVVADGLSVDATREGVSLSGFVGRPAAAKATPRDQYVFVNGRSVRDRLMLGALKAAYGDTIPRDRHPVAVLFLAIDPADVDVNVHPAKAEVRFRDAAHMRALLISAVREALAKDVAGQGATAGLAAKAVAAVSPLPSARPAAPILPFALRAALPQRPISVPRVSGFGEAAQTAFEAFAPAARAAETSVAPQDDHPLGAARAQLHATYIVAETADGLVIVDQHAAHERLVYESLKRAWGERGIARQILLIPEIVHLPQRDADALLGEAETLERDAVGAWRSRREAALVRSRGGDRSLGQGFEPR
jgi:DNA mismatch repair protein MutL